LITRVDQVGVAQADEPLSFGFGYCPLGSYFTVGLSRGSVDTSVAVDYGYLPPVGAPDTPQANITRTITYGGYEFSTTTGVTMQVNQPPQLYPLGGQTLWPFLDRVSYFSPALQKLETSIAPQLSAYPHPLEAFGELQFTNSLPDFLSYNTPLIQPNLGAMAAQLVGGAVDLANASLWLGWLLRAGQGQQALAQMLTATYQAWQASRTAPSPGKPRIPTIAGVTPGQKGPTSL
jgi:hypothetical protein